MHKVLILGASGSIAREVTRLFLAETDAELTLFVRDPRRLPQIEAGPAHVVQGDVFDAAALKDAMAGQDVVFAGLAGDLERMAATIVSAMDETGPRRLIFISSMGMYNEIPGETYKSVLDPYRKAAAVIEASDLDYTILRPAWFTDADEVDYETTQKGEPFRGGIISRKSVAALVVKLAITPDLEVRRSLGVSKPG
jgi:uncharacterized protein YbjT (DUF2867 family)